MRTTQEVIEAMYAAFLAGDKDGMLAVMHDDVEVRFLGQAEVRGKVAANAFFEFAGGLLTDVRFTLGEVLVDGEWGAGIWEETAVTADGHPWSNHGVDVVRVRDGLVVALHENNDTRQVYRYLPPYRPADRSLAAADDSRSTS
ncbi:nuclear transport factor 2 family protein [Terrabacter terrigena]|uniref:Nuclear transport factor 2 family protein n=1 Tax=Terrabacter terrigena TaxID=574718 RepID=A0ABW3MV93_9MICO